MYLSSFSSFSLLVCEEIISRMTVFIHQQKIIEREGNYHPVVDILQEQGSMTLFLSFNCFYIGGNGLMFQWYSPLLVGFSYGLMPPSLSPKKNFFAYEINSNVFFCRKSKDTKKGKLIKWHLNYHIPENLMTRFISLNSRM